MENLVVEVAENAFNDIPGFPYRRRTLPEKIIRLRKVSQECHVRRMKSAFQRKQMQALQGTSDLSLSFSSCSMNSVNRTSISSTSAAINCRNVDNYCNGDKNEDSSSHVNNFPTKSPHYNNRKKDFRTGFTNVNRRKKSDNLPAENNSVKSDSALDICCRKKSMIHPNCKINKMYNSGANNDKTSDVEDGRKLKDKNGGKNDKNLASSDALLKGNTSSKGNWRPFDNIMDSINLNRLKLRKDRNYEDSLNTSLENFHLKDAKDIEVGAKYSNTSKIPILQSRLSSGKKTTPKQSLQTINNCKSNSNNSTNSQHSSKVTDVNGSNENSEAKTPKEIKINTPKKSLIERIPQDLQCKSEENSCNVGELNSNTKELSSTLHSVSKWLQDSLAKAKQNNENSNVSQAKSLVVDFEDRSMENLSLKSLTTPKTNVFKTDSSLTYIVKGSCSGSDESLDDYYETETGDDVVKNVTNSSDEDQNDWEESDDDSTILTADIEDKIVSTPENCTKSKYSDAPDYPKTPYDLRYPRYYTRGCNEKEKKVEENSAQSKTPKKKIRRKSYNFSPKIKRGKKAKASISGKMQASKNKKA